MYKVTVRLDDGREVVYDTFDNEADANGQFDFLVSERSPCLSMGKGIVELDELYKGSWVKLRTHLVVP